MQTLYHIAATAKGGRNGHVRSENGVLDIDVAIPKALGGANDEHANPEMLFAAGYAACFDSALNLVIKKTRTKTGETSVTVQIGIEQLENGGFGLTAELHANIPGVTHEEAQVLLEKAHGICPYSNATKGNIKVQLSV